VGQANLSLMHFRFVLVVWGQTFTDLFLTVALPSQLSPGNFPSFPDRAESKYLIYTTSAGAESIRESRAFAELSKLMETEIVGIDDLDFSRNKYSIVGDCQRRALETASQENCGFVFLYADQIWSDGSFTNMAKISARGKRALMGFGLSSVKETFVPDLVSGYSSPDGETISISSRQLVALSLKHSEPALQSQYWDSETFDNSPSCLYWNVPNEGVLARWFHLSPLMVRPSKSIVGFDGSLDSGDFLLKACPDPNDLYVVEDSDEIFMMSVQESREEFLPRKASATNVAHWASGVTNQHNRRFLKYKLRIHYADLSRRWEQVEQESDKVVNLILLILKARVVFWVLDWKKSLGRLRWSLRHSRLGDSFTRMVRKESP